MKRRRLFLAACSSLFPSMAAFAQAPREKEASSIASAGVDERRELAFEGFVLAPDGNPVTGAVVVSSAGGQALTDATGGYWLVVDVPRDAMNVQVTAVGRAGANLAASTSVAVSGRAGTLLVDPLQLALGTTCSPTWLPTFGGEPGAGGRCIARWIGPRRNCHNAS